MPSARRWPCGRLLAISFFTALETQEVEDLVARSAEGFLVAPRHGGADIETEQARARAQVMSDDDVVAHGQPLEDRRLLEGPHHALSSDDVRREAGDTLAFEQHLAARRLHERRDQLEEGRLARAVRADDGEDFPGSTLKRHIVDGDQAAIALGQVPDLAGSGPSASGALSSEASAGSAGRSAAPASEGSSRRSRSAADTRPVWNRRSQPK